MDILEILTVIAALDPQIIRQLWTKEIFRLSRDLGLVACLRKLVRELNALGHEHVALDKLDWSLPLLPVSAGPVDLVDLEVANAFVDARNGETEADLG